MKKQHIGEGNDLSGSLNSSNEFADCYSMSIKDKDANVMQKMGIYFRQKKEYERAAGLLERVLEYKKRKFVEKKISNKDNQSNDDSEEDYMDQFIG